jgi:hypothetical protein
MGWSYEQVLDLPEHVYSELIRAVEEWTRDPNKP